MRVGVLGASASNAEERDVDVGRRGGGRRADTGRLVGVERTKKITLALSSRLGEGRCYYKENLCESETVSLTPRSVIAALLEALLWLL